MKSSTLLVVLAVLVAGGLIAFAAVKKNGGPSPYNSFAQCLTDKNVTMYGAWWCPHCKAQKELFGSSFDNINYVECSDANKNMNQTCKDAGVTGYPMWKFADGSTLSGEQTFDVLGAKAGCEVNASTESTAADTNASSNTEANP